MDLVAIVFWFSAAPVIYTYVGYPLVLIALSAAHQLRSDCRQLSRASTRRVSVDGPPLSVAVLVAAFNEERHIEERVRNLLAQTYAGGRLHVYVGSDASNDRTAEILRGMACDRLTFIDFAQRRGKASVINDLAGIATEQLLVFTDANTFFHHDAVQKLVRHFGVDDVGCVCGDLRLVKGAPSGDNQDHFYWRYERMLKFFESRIGGLLGANGGVYALRRELFVPIPANTIVDDFWISMQVVESGRRCVYDPEAIATEVIPERVCDEFRRRVRIGMGNYQSLIRFAGLLKPDEGTVAFTFFSHKVLRWFAPHCMVVALVCNALLLADEVYAALFLAQVAFYGCAWFGWQMARRGCAPRALRVPVFFVGMNIGLLVGFWKFAITPSSSGAWSRSAR
jgi:cellulose synthase/poly-beta-1,6-N-acetylglucosamine synthase-like glycosyltransferase